MNSTQSLNNTYILSLKSSDRNLDSTLILRHFLPKLHFQNAQVGKNFGFLSTELQIT